jgi:Protein of unknown function (DUF1217)
MQLSGFSPLLAYQIADNSKASQLKVFESQPTTQREITNFKKDIVNVKSVDDLLNNRNALKVTLSAFQLEGEIDKTAFLKKIMTEDPTNKKSLAYRMVEPRYTKLATALQGLNQDPNFFQNSQNVDAIFNAYKTNEFEKFEGQNALGVREAMYFKRLAGGIQDIPQIMADKTLMEVVRVGLGLPQEFQSLSFQQQKDRLIAQVDVADFKDPKKIDKMIERYLIFTELNNPNAGAVNNPMLSLFQPIPSGGFVGPQPLSINLAI